MLNRRQNAAGKKDLIKKVSIAGAAIIVILLIVFMLSGSDNTRAAEEKKIVEKGSLYVGISDLFPDFSNGETGFEVAIATEIANYIFSGYEESSAHLTLVCMNPAFMESHISDGSIDMALMMCPKGLYGSKYAYSTAYYTDDCYIAVKAGSDKSASLNKKELGVISNSICSARINDYCSKNKVSAKIIEYPTYETMLNALKNGDIYACVLQGVCYKKYCSSYPLTLHSVKLEDIEYSVVCSSEKPGLSYTASTVISGLNKSGKMKEYLARYLGE